MLGMLNRWPLVGRSGELELVGDLLAGGERSAVVLAGLAGVGKTRLASECLSVAELPLGALVEVEAWAWVGPS